MRILGEFHAAMGELIGVYEATLERFAGDGMMIFLPLLNFEWVMVRDAGSPRPGVKGGLRGYRSPAKRTLDAWNRAIRWPVAGCSGVVHPAMETSAMFAQVRCAPL
jgi:class 3 adenylate cyclase